MLIPQGTLQAIKIFLHKFTNPKCMVTFLFLPKCFYFCSLTKCWYKCCVQTYWSCIHNCIGTYSKIFSELIIAYTEIKLCNMVLTFTVANINICVKWLLIGSYLPFTQTKKACGSKQNKNCCTYRILKTVQP